MHRMAGTLGDYVSQQRSADESQISDEVQYFMAAGLVGKTQAARVHDGAPVEAETPR